MLVGGVGGGGGGGTPYIRHCAGGDVDFVGDVRIRVMVAGFYRWLDY